MTQGGPPKKRRNMVGVTGSGERGERGGDQACGAEGDENGGWRGGGGGGGWFDGDDEIRIRVTTLADGYHYQTQTLRYCL